MKMESRLNDIVMLSAEAPSGKDILDKCLELTELLLEKNISYGNSAMDPIRVFSRASPEEQILVRLDDKLSRIKDGKEFKNEDTILDLCGYLVLLLVLREEK